MIDPVVAGLASAVASAVHGVVRIVCRRRRRPAAATPEPAVAELAGRPIGSHVVAVQVVVNGAQRVSVEVATFGSEKVGR